MASRVVPVALLFLLLVSSSPALPCDVGVTSWGQIEYSYQVQPGETYYTLLDLGACGCPSGVLLGLAEVNVYFPSFGDCSVPVSLTTVRADLADPACPRPLPADVLCPPIAAWMRSDGVPGMVQFGFNMDPTCCLTGKVFLAVTFTGAPLEGGAMPRLVTAEACAPCVSWRGSPGSLVDACGLGLTGNPQMFVRTTCCDQVPAHAPTWGTLKSLYR